MRPALIVTLACTLLIASLAEAEDNKGDSLSCPVGPLAKDIGGTPWLIFACDDGKSLAVTTAPSNPAAPFYFVVVAQEGAYVVNGEGDGNKAAAKPTFDALLAMKSEGVVALYKEVIEGSKQAASKSSPPDTSRAPEKP